jgi:hypothetical protein
MAEEISPLEDHGWWMERLRKDAKANRPEALRLADAMTRALEQTDAEDDVIQVARWFVEDSRAELRRLHAVNAELLEALKECLPYVGQTLANTGSMDEYYTETKASAAIAKAEGQT